MFNVAEVFPVVERYVVLVVLTEWCLAFAGTV